MNTHDAIEILQQVKIIVSGFDTAMYMLKLSAKDSEADRNYQTISSHICEKINDVNKIIKWLSENSTK